VAIRRLQSAVEDLEYAPESADPAGWVDLAKDAIRRALRLLEPETRPREDLSKDAQPEVS